MALRKIYFTYHKTTGSAKNLDTKVQPPMEQEKVRHLHSSDKAH